MLRYLYSFVFPALVLGLGDSASAPAERCLAQVGSPGWPAGSLQDYSYVDSFSGWSDPLAESGSRRRLVTPRHRDCALTVQRNAGVNISGPPVFLMKESAPVRQRTYRPGTSTSVRDRWLLVTYVQFRSMSCFGANYGSHPPLHATRGAFPVSCRAREYRISLPASQPTDLGPHGISFLSTSPFKTTPQVA